MSRGNAGRQAAVASDSVVGTGSTEKRMRSPQEEEEMPVVMLPPSAVFVRSPSSGSWRHTSSITRGTSTAGRLTTVLHRRLAPSTVVPIPFSCRFFARCATTAAAAVAVVTTTTTRATWSNHHPSAFTTDDLFTGLMSINPWVGIMAVATMADRPELG